MQTISKGDSSPKTIQQFIAKHGIGMSYSRISSRGDLAADNFSRDAFHYAITLSVGRSSMDFNYSMGSAHVDKDGRPTPPELPDVLDCLAGDYAGYKNARDFEDWASEYGYDTDSRKAESTYEAVTQQSIELENLLGIPACNELAFECERL